LLISSYFPGFLSFGIDQSKPSLSESGIAFFAEESASVEGEEVSFTTWSPSDEGGEGDGDGKEVGLTDESLVEVGTFSFFFRKSKSEAGITM